MNLQNQFTLKISFYPDAMVVYLWPYYLMMLPAILLLVVYRWEADYGI